MQSILTNFSDTLWALPASHCTIWYSHHLPWVLCYNTLFHGCYIHDTKPILKKEKQINMYGNWHTRYLCSQLVFFVFFFLIFCPQSVRKIDCSYGMWSITTTISSSLTRASDRVLFERNPKDFLKQTSIRCQ